jgi:hypothetical protein
LSTCGEIGHMCLNNGIGIVVEQPRGPQCGVKIVTLRLELSCEAAIQHNWTDVQSLRECGHQPNLGLVIVLFTELQPVQSERKIETGGPRGKKRSHVKITSTPATSAAETTRRRSA